MSILSDLFYERAKENPDKVAVWCDGLGKCYADLARQVSRCTNFLLDLGIKRGEHIGIPMNNSIESVALIFAAATMGVCLVPINPTLPPTAVKVAIRTGGIQHLIARESFLSQFKGREELSKELFIKGALICTDGTYPGAIAFQGVASASTERPVCPSVTGDELLLLTMTSGSTGAPKPISLTQNIKYARAVKHIEHYYLTKDDVILAATPLYHSLAERLVIMPLILGATCVLMPRFTPEKWLACVKEHSVTFTIAVSAQLGQVSELLLGPLVPDIVSLKRVVSSSALLEPRVRNALIQKLGCDFHEMYGTSETSTITDIGFRDEPQKVCSVGKSLSDVQVRILRPDGSTADPDETGEIACKTPLLCDGYYGMPEVMESQMADGFFRTGDIGRLDEDGYLYFAGRKKELIITGGVNVYPQDIEGCVGALVAVEASAAFPYPDNRLGEVVALAVVVKKGHQLRKRDIQVYCARNLADFQQPHKVFFVEALPQNAMGKIQKSNLLEYVRQNCQDCI